MEHVVSDILIALKDAGFILGLMLFAVFLLTQNLVTIVFWYILYSLLPAAQNIVPSAYRYLFLINLAGTMALDDLVSLTWK